MQIARVEAAYHAMLEGERLRKREFISAGACCLHEEVLSAFSKIASEALLRRFTAEEYKQTSRSFEEHREPLTTQKQLYLVDEQATTAKNTTYCACTEQPAEEQWATNEAPIVPAGMFRKLPGRRLLTTRLHAAPGTYTEWKERADGSEQKIHCLIADSGWDRIIRSFYILRRWGCR